MVQRVAKKFKTLKLQEEDLLNNFKKLKQVFSNLSSKYKSSKNKYDKLFNDFKNYKEYKELIEILKKCVTLSRLIKIKCGEACNLYDQSFQFNALLLKHKILEFGEFKMSDVSSLLQNCSSLKSRFLSLNTLLNKLIIDVKQVHNIIFKKRLAALKSTINDLKNNLSPIRVKQITKHKDPKVLVQKDIARVENKLKALNDELENESRVLDKDFNDIKAEADKVFKLVDKNLKKDLSNDSFNELKHEFEVFDEQVDKSLTKVKQPDFDGLFNDYFKKKDKLMDEFINLWESSSLTKTKFKTLKKQEKALLNDFEKKFKKLSEEFNLSGFLVGLREELMKAELASFEKFLDF